MRLNGWQRVGIVVSVAWAIGAAIYQRNADIERAESFAKFAYKVCANSEAIAHRNNLDRCDKEQKEHINTFMVGSWGNVAFMALAPIPCAWLACIVLITIGRAQLAGFRSVLPWGALTVPKKAFVIFSTLATGAVVLFGVIVVLNLYVDTEVPVALAPSVMVLKTGDDLVSARGTWIRSGFAAGSELAYPLQPRGLNAIAKNDAARRQEPQSRAT